MLTKPEEVCEKFFEGYFKQNNIAEFLSEDDFCSIVTTATQIMEKKFSSLIKLQTTKKIIFITDIHGCYDSFQLICDNFYRKDHVFVILGDFIDRGIFSAEIFAIVLSMIIVFGNIIYIRGNHETQTLQTCYGSDKKSLSYWIFWNYYDELGIMDKWNPFEAYENCKLINLIYNFFGQLPYAMIVDGIFCLHGGLVKGFKTINDYTKLIRKREIYDLDNELQVIWNDPLPKWTKEFKFNSERGCGNFFGKKVTENFMKTNKQVRLILKGHTRHFRYSSSKYEEINGFKFCHDDKLLTFESNFNYEKRLDEKDQTKGCVIVKDGNMINIHTFHKKVYKEYNSEEMIDSEYVNDKNNEKWIINKNVHSFKFS